MDEEPISMDPSTACPSCRSSNWISDGGGSTDTTLTCNDCGYSWVLPKRSDLKMRAYTFPCPWCGDGGVLNFDIGQLAHLSGDPDVVALDGGHMSFGDPACEVLAARWVNPPDVQAPVVIEI